MTFGPEDTTVVNQRNLMNTLDNIRGVLMKIRATTPFRNLSVNEADELPDFAKEYIANQTKEDLLESMRNIYGLAHMALRILDTDFPRPPNSPPLDAFLLDDNE
jgi:hypothetical protein